MPAIDNYHPVEDYLLCEPMEEGEMSPAGNIVIPEIVRQRQQVNTAIILRAGPEVCKKGILVEGRIVIYTLHSEMTIKFPREKYITIKEGDVVLIGPLVEKKKTENGN